MDEKLPVLVWIHGGGLVSGSASAYPGDHLARQGIVVVSANYRLGRLGFFAHPELVRGKSREVQGNYGYLDQIAALQWVKRNISAFGGDPDNVTIAGESAGGGSVLVLLTSPMASGLFKRAIVQSPAMPTARAAATPLQSLEDARASAVDYARTMTNVTDDAIALASLRVMPAEELADRLELSAHGLADAPKHPGFTHAIVDGQLVVEPPEIALRERRMARVPLLVGANASDVGMGVDMSRTRLFARFGPAAEHAEALYNPSGNHSLPEMVKAVVTDEIMIEPARFVAEQMSKTGQSAWFYHFSYVPIALRSTMKDATHASELPFVFDAVDVLLHGRATEEDLEIARIMSGYWVAFVRTGDPNGGGRPTWQRYQPSRREVLKIANDGVMFGSDPLKDRLDLWRDIRTFCPC